MERLECDLKALVPRWLLEDAETGALAAAIQAALCRFTRDVENADATLMDPQNMPEWRLDEVAWENNLRWYDINARVEIKRRWIQNASAFRRIAGTPEAIRQMLLGVYSTVRVEEWFEYGGEPYHFRVLLSGRLDPEMEEWSKRAVNIVKNVRSTFDGFTLFTANEAPVYIGAGMRRIRHMTIKAVG